MLLLLGLACSVALILLNTAIQKKNIILYSLTLAVLTGIQYGMLEQWVGVGLNLLTIAYGVLCWFDARLYWLKHVYMKVGLLIAYTMLFVWINGGVGWGVGMLAWAGSILSVTVMMANSPLLAKWLMVAMGVVWTTYQVWIGIYGQLLGQAFGFMALGYSLSWLYEAKRLGQDLKSVPEFGARVKGWWLARRSGGGLVAG